MPVKDTERNCYPCEVCEGTGTQWTERQNHERMYDPCDFCGGNQCFNVKTGDYFLGECDGSCGKNRDIMHKLGMQ
jgi:hypothetical protein